MFKFRLIKRKIPKIPSDLERPIMFALKKGMFRTERTSKRNYLSGARPEKLGVVTGRLRNSIKTRVFKRYNKFVGEIGTNVIYGRTHEEGLGSMPKRPFLQPALADNIDNITKTIETAIIKYWNKP